MSKIIAIAGGSGGLGRTFVDALKKSPYECLILSRRVNTALQDECGVPVLVADYSDQQSLVQLLESHKIDTVISCISNYERSLSIETNLVEAADRSSVTKRYIPSIWSGFDYTPEQAKGSPAGAPMISLQEALSKTNLEWTAIFTGIFLDFYTLSMPSYTKRSALALDLDANTAAIPGDGKYPVYFTHTVDIAKYTVALLGSSDWEKKYYLYADQKTWNEVLEIAETAKNAKFSVTYDSLENLERGEMTELPGHKVLYEHFFGDAGAREKFLRGMSGIAFYMAQGRMLYEGPFLHEMFPDIEPLTVKKALSG